MATQEQKIADVTNVTDPIVIFDPTFERTTVAVSYVPGDGEDPEKPDDPTGMTPGEDRTKVSGIRYPIIKIDNFVIPETSIQYMKLDFNEFLPNIELKIINDQIAQQITPGLVNKITVVLVPPADGTYRKISIDFYTTSIMEEKGSKVFFGDFFYPDLNKKYTKAIKNNGTSLLNTYELLEAIAKECKLGFASTDQCKQIADKRGRLTKSQTYIEVINEHIKFGGLDNNSYFTTWIDVYGNIVLVNLSWVLSHIVKSNELSIKSLKGVNITDNTTLKTSETIQYGDETFRTLTNWKLGNDNVNNRLATYEVIIDNDIAKYNGTDNVYYVVNHISGEGSNGILSENIKIEDESADGQNFKDVYTFQESKYLGVEVANPADGNTPVLFQEYRRNAFLAKNLIRKLKVTLSDINFGLQRGALVNINIFEYDKTLKAKMIENADNIKLEGDQSTSASGSLEDENSPITHEELLNDDSFGIPNLLLSGIYYIIGINYIYERNKLYQELFLIKQQQNTSSSYFNYSSVPKISETELQRLQNIEINNSNS